LYGKGTIQTAYRVAKGSKIIYFSIFLARDVTFKEFYVSDFNMPDRPFVELLVDSACNDEFLKSISVPAVVR
jgi:hypothetical protein